MRKRNLIGRRSPIILRFDFSESIRANTYNLINIHEPSSSLILSAFYTVLISRIRIIIIIIIIIILSVLLVFPHFVFTETLNDQKSTTISPEFS